MKSWEERSSWILFVPPPPSPPWYIVVQLKATDTQISTYILYLLPRMLINNR